MVGLEPVLATLSAGQESAEFGTLTFPHSHFHLHSHQERKKKEPTIHLLWRWKGKQRFQRKRDHEMWTLKLFLDSSSMTLVCILPGFPMERPMLFSFSIYFTFMFFFIYFITIYLLLSPMSEDPWCCLSDFRLWMASHQLKLSPSKAEVLYILGNQSS